MSWVSCARPIRSRRVGSTSWYCTMACTRAPPRRPPGSRSRKGTLRQLVVEAVGPLEELAVVGQRVAVVGQHQDEAVVVVAQPLEGLEELAQGEVDQLRLAGVEAPDVADLVVGGPVGRAAAHGHDQAAPGVGGVGVVVELPGGSHGSWGSKLSIQRKTWPVRAVALQPGARLLDHLRREPVLAAGEGVGVGQELGDPPPPQGRVVGVDVLLERAPRRARTRRGRTPGPAPSGRRGSPGGSSCPGRGSGTCPR